MIILSSTKYKLVVVCFKRLSEYFWFMICYVSFGLITYQSHSLELATDYCEREDIYNMRDTKTSKPIPDYIKS